MDESKTEFFSYIGRISSYNDNKSLIDRISVSKYPEYYLLKTIESEKELHNVEPPNLIRKIYNFKVPVEVIPKSQLFSSPITQERVEQTNSKLLEFCNSSGIHVSPLDCIKALYENNDISSNDLQDMVNDVRYRKSRRADEFFSQVSNPLSNGKLLPKSIGSYSETYYPFGNPICSGKDPWINSIINTKWVSCEQNSEENPNKRTITQQVPSSLETVEDNHTILDIDISRNSTVRKGLTDYGVIVLETSPIYTEEFMALFGKKGHLVLVLLQKNPLLLPQIMKKLIMRGSSLLEKRNRYRGEWVRELEVVLPYYRAKYRKHTKLINDFSEFKSVSTPLFFEIETVTYIWELIDLYINTRPRFKEKKGSFDQIQWKIALNTIITSLREFDTGKSVPLSFSQIQILIPCILMSQFMNEIRSLTNFVSYSRRISYDIGITHPSMHGSNRIFTILVDSVLKKKIKDGAVEISGLFPSIDVIGVISFFKTFIIALKAIKKNLNFSSEIPIAISHNIEHRFILNSLSNNASKVVIDLSPYIPKNQIK